MLPTPRARRRRLRAEGVGVGRRSGQSQVRVRVRVCVVVAPACTRMDRTRCAQNVRRPRAVRPTHSSRPVCATCCARLCVCVSLYLALSASGYLCVRCFRLCVSVCVCVFPALRVCVSLFVRRPPCWASGPSVCRVCLCLRAVLVLVCACMSGRERQRERKWLRPCLSSPSPSLTLLLVSVGVPAGPLRGTSIKGVGCSTWTGSTTSTSLSSSPSLVLVSLCFPFSLSLSLLFLYGCACFSSLSSFRQQHGTQRRSCPPEPLSLSLLLSFLGVWLFASEMRRAVVWGGWLAGLARTPGCGGSGPLWPCRRRRHRSKVLVPFGAVQH